MVSVRPTSNALENARPREPAAERPIDGFDAYLARFEALFDDYAREIDERRRRHPGYQAAVSSLARFYARPGARVLEVGCATGDLLAALAPADGVGVDVSPAMVRRASERHPELTFLRMPAERLDLPHRTFDYIVLSDLVGYLYDIREAFQRLAAVSHPGTRIVIHWYSRVWQPVVQALERFGLKYPLPLLNWTTVGDVENLLRLSGFEVVRARGHILVPLSLGFVSRWANRYLAHLPGLRSLVWSNWIVARPVPRPRTVPPRVSVVCPVRNEKDNIEDVVRRLPALGAHTELLFVEGNSSDGTIEECRRVAAAYPDRDVKVLVQRGRGKGDAVRLGFAEADGDLLVILDADLAVPPEDLRQFVDALTSGVAEFTMGSRLVYSMDRDAMPFANLVANRFFGMLLSRIIGQPIKDTLCGTKVLWRSDYKHVASGRAHLGDLDPFGDFDLILGAAKLNLRIVEVPVRYRARAHGDSKNVTRLSDGWLLVRMSAVAARRLYFVG